MDSGVQWPRVCDVRLFNDQVSRTNDHTTVPQSPFNKHLCLYLHITMDIDTEHFLDTVGGEISFFRSLMRTRPVGIHRHFHVLAMRNSIHRDTGHWVTADDLWAKLRSCYDLDILEGIDAEHYEGNSTGNSPPQPIRSPSPSSNLNTHPFFREEFSLPHDATFESIMARRRRRGTASISSASEAPMSPAVEKPVVAGRSTKRGKAKLTKMAGLVGGDSDSSALTQDSADESPGSIVQRQGSMVTGTDGGTEFAEVEEEEDPEGVARDQSPAAAKITRRQSKASASTKKGARTRGSSVSKPPTKKRKR